MILVLVVSGFVSTTNAQSDKDAFSDEALLRVIEGQTAHLEQANDVSIAKYLADDWVCACPRALSKKEFVANVKSNLDTHENGINPYIIVKRNMVVHVFGDTAVVTYIKEYRQTPDTTKFFNEDDTDVFTKDGAGWHLRFTRISPVQQQTAGGNSL